MKKRDLTTNKTRLICIISSILLTISLTGCFSENAVEDDIDGVLKAQMKKTQTEDMSADTDLSDIPVGGLHNSFIEPLPMAYDSASPKDCTVNASFTIKDFDIENGTLSFTAYNMELYDAAEISLMQIGDTLNIDGREIVIESIQDKDGELLINGGIDENGVNLISGEDGTYKAHGYDDYATYAEVGKSTLSFSEDLIVTDSYKDASAPVEATFENLDKYLKNLTGAADSFSYVSTTLEISGGKIKSITRIWIP